MKNALIARAIRPIFKPMRVPDGWELLAELHRSEASHVPDGHIARNRHTGAYVEFWGGGSMRSLPQRQVVEALNKAGFLEDQAVGSDDEREQLAAMLRAWRGRAELNTRTAGELLGLSPRTIEGIEQGRGFSHPRLLVLALKAFD